MQSKTTHVLLPLLATLAVPAVASANETNHGQLKRGYLALKGSFEVDGNKFAFRLPLDLYLPKGSDPIERRAVILPEQYKRYFDNAPQNYTAFLLHNEEKFETLDSLSKSTAPTFQSLVGKSVKCEGISQPGTQGWVGKTPSSINCTYQIGNSSDAEIVSFPAYILKATKSERAYVKNMNPRFKEIKPDSKTIRYSDTDNDIALSLKLDTIAYQSGSNHTAYIYPKRIEQQLNQQLPSKAMRVKQCSDVKSGNKAGLVGSSPKLSCTLYVKGDYAKHDPRAYKQIELK